MIRITIDMWPGGDPNRSRRLGAINISNITPGSDKSDYRGDYKVETFGASGVLIRSGHVMDWPRLRNPVFALIKKALEACGY